MLLACSIENANVSIGVFDGDRLVLDARLATVRERTADEYAILLSGIFAMNQLTPAAVDAAILASVVRPLSMTISRAIEQLTGVRPLQVGPGLKTGLNIKTDIPSQLGADIVANAVAAITLAAGPLVFIDFGTATTLTAINEKGELCGVLICPGLRTGLDALSSRAAELPAVALETPRALLGRNTIESMTSGVVLGHAAMVDGLLDRIAADWGHGDPADPPLTVIATGELAERVIPHCRSRHRIEAVSGLSLLGLKRIHQLNQRHRT